MPVVLWQNLKVEAQPTDHLHGAMGQSQSIRSSRSIKASWGCDIIRISVSNASAAHITPTFSLQSWFHRQGCNECLLMYESNDPNWNYPTRQLPHSAWSSGGCSKVTELKSVSTRFSEISIWFRVDLSLSGETFNRGPVNQCFTPGTLKKKIAISWKSRALYTASVFQSLDSFTDIRVYSLRPSIQPTIKGRNPEFSPYPLDEFK